MPLDEVIDLALGGNSILFLGSGFSVGAVNKRGEKFLTGEELKRYFAKKCEDLSDEEYASSNLADITEYYIERQELSVSEKESRKQNLIHDLQDLFCVSCVKDYHNVILSVPWKRIYTTNYDDVVEVSSKRNENERVPIVLSASIQEYIKKNICVHLNGYIKKLSTRTIKDEFKLLDSSYTENTLQGNPWFDYMKEDFFAADRIIVIGYSFSTRDADINRIFALPKLRQKIAIISYDGIEKKNLTVSRLKKYGALYTPGLPGFAERIEKCRKKFRPSPLAEKPFLSFCEYKSTNRALKKPTLEEYNQFYVYGKYKQNIFLHNDGHSSNPYESIVYRKQVTDFVQRYQEQRHKVFLITSDLGNGKTIFCEMLKREVHTFCKVFVFLRETEGIAGEVERISQIKDDVLVIIEDCYSSLHILSYFSHQPMKHITFLMTTRMSLASHVRMKIKERLDLRKKELLEIPLQKLEDEECRGLAEIFCREQLRKGYSEEALYHRFTEKCKSSMADIILDLLEAQQIKDRLEKLMASAMRPEMKSVREVVILGMCISTWKLSLTRDDLFFLLKVDNSAETEIEERAILKELIGGDNTTEEVFVKSSIIAEYMVKHVVDVWDLCCVLKKTIEALDCSCRSNPRYVEALKAIISHANYSSFTETQEDKQKIGAIKDLYESVRKFKFYRDNPFYWEQYGSACIDAGDFNTAKKCIGNAYDCAKEKENFVPFQIETVEARCYLEQAKANIDQFSPKEILSDYITEAQRLLLKHYHHEGNNKRYSISIAEKIFDLFEEKKNTFTVEDFSRYIEIMKTFSAKWGMSKDVEEIEERELESFLKSAQMSIDDANKQISLKKKKDARKPKKTFSE
jgi:hypothetical protein